jgi:hypothetical protein
MSKIDDIEREHATKSARLAFDTALRVAEALAADAGPEGQAAAFRITIGGMVDAAALDAQAAMKMAERLPTFHAGGAMRPDEYVVLRPGGILVEGRGMSRPLVPRVLVRDDEREG